MRVIPLVLLLAAPLPLRAQAPYPDLLSDWERNRTTVLAYIDAMPDSAASFRPTPGVRTFAQQFDHLVSTNLEVAAIALRGLKAAPALADSGVYLHDKVALRRYAVSTYDYLLDALRHASPAQLRRPVVMYRRNRPCGSRPCRSSTPCGPWASWCPIFG
jgi:hypothetical protein